MHTATNIVLRVVTGVFIKDKKPIIVDERRDRSVDLMIFDKRSSSATTPSSSEPSMPKFYPLDASHGPAMALLSAHLLLEPTPQQTTFPFHQYLQQQQPQQPQSMYYCTPMLPPMPSHTPQQHQQHPLVTPLYSQHQPPVLGYYPTPSPQSPLNQLLPQLSTTPSSSHTRRKPVRPLYQQQQDDERRDTRTTSHHYQQQQQQQEPPSRQHRIPRKQPQYLAPGSSNINSNSNSNSSNNQSRRVRFANTLQVMTYDAEEEQEDGGNLAWDDMQDDLYQQDEEGEEQYHHRRRNSNRVFGLYTPSARKRSYQYAPHSASYY